MRVNDDTFRADALDLGPLSVCPHDLVSKRREWHSTTWPNFIESQCLLLKCLVLCDESKWGTIACSSSIPTGTIFRFDPLGDTFLCYHGAKYLLRSILLEPKLNDDWGDDVYWTNSGRHVDQPLTTLKGMECAWQFVLGIDTSNPRGYYVAIRDWMDADVFICRVSLWRFTKAQISDFSFIVGMPRLSTNQRVIPMITAVLDALGIYHDVRAEILGKAEARLAKRKRASAQPDGKADDDDVLAPRDPTLGDDVHPDVKAAVRKDVAAVAADKASKPNVTFESDSDGNSDETDGGVEWPEPPTVMPDPSDLDGGAKTPPAPRAESPVHYSQSPPRSPLPPPPRSPFCREKDLFGTPTSSASVSKTPMLKYRPSGAHHGESEFVRTIIFYFWELLAFVY
jgi:hypothetical protein